MFYAKCAKNEQSVDGGHKWIIKYHGNLKQFFCAQMHKIHK